MKALLTTIGIFAALAAAAGPRSGLPAKTATSISMPTAAQRSASTRSWAHVPPMIRSGGVNVAATREGSVADVCPATRRLTPTAT